MPSDPVPAEISELAERRAAARRARDWATADALRARIEEAGWSIVDAGTLYTLRRAHPPDITDGPTVRYGASASVPSRLDEPPAAPATVVLVATDWPDDLDRAIGSIAAQAPRGTQLIIVANGPSPEQAARLTSAAAGDATEDATLPGATGMALDAALQTEVVWLRERLGHAAALNAGMRRAAGAVIVSLDTSVEPEWEMLGAMIAALADPTVAVTGPFGLVSADLRRFHEPPFAAEDQDVVAIEGYAQAFRRDDYAQRGPLDEHFTFYRNLDIWWSLVLRDQGPGEPGRPRRAVALGGLSVVRHEHRDWSRLSDDERNRLSKRNFYRILKRFASRGDLLLET